MLPFTRADLREDLRALGIVPGDVVMVHASLRAIGPVLGGPDSVIAAILDAASPAGTLLCYTDWHADYEDLRDERGELPPALRPHVPPFVPEASRAARYLGSLGELVRTYPEALRSGNPGASCAAVGARAAWLTAEHVLDFGYGPASPFGKLVTCGGKVLMLGAPLDTMTLLHHAEHLAQIPGKRLVRTEVPLQGAGGAVWREIEEFDTSDPVVSGLADTYFSDIVEAFLATGRGHTGTVGRAPSVLVPAAEIVAFAVAWLETHFGA